MSDSKIIISIGRQYGSGGREIGRKLAEVFGIDFYDKELITLVAKQSGYSEEVLKENDENHNGSFLYSLVMGTYSGGDSLPLNHKLFIAQFDTIKKLAAEKSCVIIGRCADYALADNPECINVLIHAEIEDRIKWISKRLNITENKAKDTIQKKDKQRASYYNYYTSKKWGDSKSYDLCLDSAKLGIDGCVDMILKFREIIENK